MLRSNIVPVGVFAALSPLLLGSGVRLSMAIVALVLTVPSAEASEILEIKYDLSGVLTTDPGTLVNPIYSPGAPGPAGLGSSVTFRFSPIPAGGVAVDLLSFVQSHGMSDLPYLSGYQRQTLLSPITGGFLSGSTAVGMGSGVANLYGSGHCFTDPDLCSQILHNTVLSYPFGLTRLGVPAYFAGATSRGAVGNGWVFNSNMSTLQADRPTLVGRFSRLVGTASLVGTEVGRTVIPMPEPGPIQLLAPALVLLGLVEVRRALRRARQAA